jgi:hypothetical protein
MFWKALRRNSRIGLVSAARLSAEERTKSAIYGMSVTPIMSLTRHGTEAPLFSTSDTEPF